MGTERVSAGKAPCRGCGKAAARAPVQRMPAARAFAADETEGGQVHPGVLRPSSGGAPLPPPVREKMEAAFGHDFRNVRVHHGGEAESIDAVAFARGTHLHFAPGRYQPHTPSGQRLLGHELAHVVQQRAGRVARPGGPVPINDSAALEREAEAAGVRAAGGRAAGVAGAAQAAPLQAPFAPAAAAPAQTGAGPVQRVNTKSTALKKRRKTVYSQVDYGSSEGRMARKYRRRHKLLKKPGVNIATVKYVKGLGKKRKVRYVTRRSDSKAVKHSEEKLQEVQNHPMLKGFKPEYMYTEREPCGHGQGLRNCRGNAVPASGLDEDDVHFTSDYPDQSDFMGKKTTRSDAIAAARKARAEANDDLADAITDHRPGVDSDPESEDDYDELTDSDFP